MTLGVQVRTRTAGVAHGIPVDTGTLFLAGKSGTGPTDEAALVQSPGDVSAVFGPRAVGNAALLDELDGYFGEGGQRAYVGLYDTDVLDALALFDSDKGPGQVCAPEETHNASTYAKLIAHAKPNGRHAVLDVPAAATTSSLITLGGTARALADASYGSIYGSHVIIPPPAGVIGGSARTIPASPIIAALMSRADGLGNPNRAAAGRDFPLQYATGFETSFTKADREAILNAGINTFATIYGVLENYGFQTPVAQDPDNPYWQANCSRTRMWIQARGAAVGEPYEFKPIDGRNRLAGRLKTDLDAMLLGLYQVDGLFGATPQEAFATAVGASVNTIGSIAQGELHAVCEARLSLHAKAVIIDLVTVPVTGSVSS